MAKDQIASKSGTSSNVPTWRTQVDSASITCIIALNRATPPSILVMCEGKFQHRFISHCSIEKKWNENCTWRIFLSKEQSSVFWLDNPPAWSMTSFIMLANIFTACHMNTAFLIYRVITFRQKAMQSINSQDNVSLSLKLDLGYWYTNLYYGLSTPLQLDLMLTFGKILEKHSFSSSDNSICGRNISVITFRTPVETCQSWIKIGCGSYLQIVHCKNLRM